MFFNPSTTTRPMKRRALLALIAESEKDVYRIAAERRANQSTFDRDGFLRLDPLWGCHAHRRETLQKQSA